MGGHNNANDSSNEISSRFIQNVECSEDDDPEDELYIDEGTKKNNGVSMHIMYVHALSYRMIQRYDMALQSYAKVMKRFD